MATSPRQALDESSTDLSGIEGFACPEEPFDSALHDELVLEYAKGWMEAFRRRFAAELDRNGPGVVSHFEAWRAGDPQWTTAWTPALAALRSAVLGRTRDPLRAAACCALQLAADGAHGTWALAMREPYRFLWKRWILPPVARIEADATVAEPYLEVTCADGRGLRLGGDEEESSLEARGAELLPLVSWGSAPVHVLGQRALEALPELPDARGLSTAASSDVIEAMRAARALLEVHAPAYLPWIERVLRGVVALDGSDGRMHSSSSDGLPGILSLSVPHAPVAIAEMLVHESSHQYYNIVRRMGPVHDDGLGETCYSPFKETERPPDAILLAFHAFCNVLLFYRSCAESGIRDGGFCESNYARHRTELRFLTGYLERSRAIHPLGRALWEPLVRRLPEMTTC